MGQVAEIFTLNETLPALEPVQRSAQTDFNQLIDAHARRWQQSTLPQQIDHENIQVRWMFESFEHLSGDGLNYWLRDGKLHFYLIDAAGHGSAAAMDTLALQPLIDGADLSDPARVTQQLHNSYTRSAENRRYFTMMSGCLDIGSREMVYCQAGHPGPMIVDSQSTFHRRMGTGGFPIGLIDNATFENQTLTLDPEKSLILHSDGLAEHGCQVFEHFLNEQHCLSEQHCMRRDELVDKVINWRTGIPVEDDISALFISLPA